MSRGSRQVKSKRVNVKPSQIKSRDIHAPGREASLCALFIRNNMMIVDSLGIWQTTLVGSASRYSVLRGTGTVPRDSVHSSVHARCRRLRARAPRRVEQQLIPRIVPGSLQAERSPLGLQLFSSRWAANAPPLRDEARRGRSRAQRRGQEHLRCKRLACRYKSGWPH